MPHLVVKCLIRSKTVVVLPPFAAICRLTQSDIQGIYYPLLPAETAVYGIVRQIAAMISVNGK